MKTINLSCFRQCLILMCAYELQGLFMFVLRDAAVNNGGVYI